MSDDAQALTAERDETERADLLRTVGLSDGAKVPPAVRSQLKELKDNQERRAKRSVRDGLDRVLTDLQSLFRDIVLLQLGRDVDLVNVEYIDEMRQVAEARPATHTITVLDHLAETRAALGQNVQPALALESLLITVVTGRRP